MFARRRMGRGCHRRCRGGEHTHRPQTAGTSSQGGSTGMAGQGTRRTVLIAGGANLFVGMIKLAAGIMVGSGAMLAEAAHSAADTLNQGFLLASLRQGKRPGDARHPFGYGQERYFWSLLAAFGIFIAGAGFSVFEGLLALRRGGSENPLIAYVVLAVAGLALAAFGLALRQMTGSPAWDGAASIAIGGLLVAVAVKLGLQNRDFLIGRAADPRELAMIREEIEKAPGVDELLELLTMYLGPDHLIVAARVAFSDEISADRAEDVADGIDKRLADRLPLAPHVVLDTTQTPSGSQAPGTR